MTLDWSRGSVGFGAMSKLGWLQADEVFALQNAARLFCPSIGITDLISTRKSHPCVCAATVMFRVSEYSIRAQMGLVEINDYCSRQQASRQ